MFKRIFTLLFCLLLIFVSIPLFGLTEFFSVPVYADSDLPTGYEPANTNTDLVRSFSDYVKSRNANFDGSLPDATNLYILNKMRKGAEELNTNLDTIKQNLAKKSSAGGRIIWYLDSTVTDFYNDLFDFLLRDLDLEVGDTADQENNTLYSGKYFVDADGIGSLIYVYDSNADSDSRPSQFGTPYKYDMNDIIILVGSTSYTFNFNLNSSQSASSTLTKYMNGASTSITNGSGYSNGFRVYLKSYVNNSSSKPVNGLRQGNYAIMYIYNKYYFGMIANITQNGTGPAIDNYACTQLVEIDNSSTPLNAIVFITTNNKTINNNHYEGDTYITNEGDVTNNNPDSTPTPGGQDPGWDVGGGQGSYNDGNGNSYTINFPDFELPDLNIDWSIQGLGNKFPFSIPFDIVSLVTVLNAEPEAPRFQGTVNFGFTTWDYDINLQQFDTVAQVCRIAELLLLVFGLILITRSIIKG